VLKLPFLRLQDRQNILLHGKSEAAVSDRLDEHFLLGHEERVCQRGDGIFFPRHLVFFPFGVLRGPMCLHVVQRSRASCLCSTESKDTLVRSLRHNVLLVQSLVCLPRSILL
jgi:hypothetical protein